MLLSNTSHSFLFIFMLKNFRSKVARNAVLYDLEPYLLFFVDLLHYYFNSLFNRLLCKQQKLNKYEVCCFLIQQIISCCMFVVALLFYLSI